MVEIGTLAVFGLPSHPLTPMLYKPVFHPNQVWFDQSYSLTLDIVIEWLCDLGND